MAKSIIGQQADIPEVRMISESEAALRKIFSENPDVKQAFKDTLDELSKPENVKRDSDVILKMINFIKGNTSTKE